MIQLDRLEVENFINKVFFYYNGRINTFNYNCRLSINWIQFPLLHQDADFMQPNHVIIYPIVIDRWACVNCHKAEMSQDRYMDWETVFKFYIVESVIHELYHADQVLIYGRYNKETSEIPVERETALYMANHKNEICKLFNIGADFDKLMEINMNKLIPVYYPYRRRDIASHAATIMGDILYGYDIFVDEMIRALNFCTDTNAGTIVLRIDGIEFIITHDGLWYDINDLNNFVNDKFYCKGRSGIVKFRKIKFEDKWVLEIHELELRDEMCTLVDYSQDDYDYNN
jgi:hypothetical protein